MVSKQKSIFSKIVEPKPKKEKVAEDLIPFEESIFAKKKKDEVKLNVDTISVKEDCVSIEDTIFCHKFIDKDNEDTKFEEQEGEVPFEESIFSKRKKSSSTVFKVQEKDNKFDPDELFRKYKDIYANEYILNIERLNMIDSDTFNRCCSLLEESRNVKLMNVEFYDLVKRVIKSKCTCVEDVFYSYYANISVSLINLIYEISPDITTDNLYHIIDRSYSEVIEEYGKNIKVC